MFVETLRPSLESDLYGERASLVPFLNSESACPDSFSMSREGFVVAGSAQIPSASKAAEPHYTTAELIRQMINREGLDSRLRDDPGMILGELGFIRVRLFLVWDFSLLRFFNTKKEFLCSKMRQFISGISAVI